MLLTQMISDKEGYLFGATVDGKKIPLSVPTANAIVGKPRRQGRRDLDMAEAEKRLMERAIIDTGKYYCIRKGYHQENDSIYVIPYITFEK